MGAVWIDSLKIPKQVEGAPERKLPKESDVGGFQNGNCSYGPDKAGNSVSENLPQLSGVKEIPIQSVKSGNQSPLFEKNMLMNMHVKRGNMVDARNVFENMLKRNVVSWNVMIMGYAKQEQGGLALELYARMHQEDIRPSDRTFVGVLKACCSLAVLEEAKHVNGKPIKTGCLEKGRSIHFQVLKCGFESYVFVGTTLVDMYAKCGSMEDALQVFHELPCRDVVLWTAMISGYAQKDEGALALEMYTRMHREGVIPDQQAFVGVLNGCSSLAALEEGQQVDGNYLRLGCLEKGRAIHFQLMKSGFESNVYVGNTLVDMYARCGSMEDARCVFDELPHRNIVSWNTMILGYAEQEENGEAFKLHEQMEEQGLSANSVTFVSILKACGNTAALETAKELHAQICRAGLETTAIVATTLIDTYAKCGSMVDAQQLFDASFTRDNVTWNALIAGYARQGETELVFHLFERMKQESVQPSKLTFLSVLTACSHAGLVDKGQMYFQAMSKDFGILPSIEHYNCMIDLLGRVGQLEEAMEMLEKMLVKPNAVAWITLLSACQKWKNVRVGRHAFEHALRLDKKNVAAYVLMSNIYAQDRMWEDHDKVQLMRKKLGVWKTPGKSWWTDIAGRVHVFVVEDRRHPQSKDIYAKLQDLTVKMKQVGYVPDLDCVLQDISDDKKEDSLCGHSEKLAIAYALMNTPEGTPIRIVKNLRVCSDCHNVTALISKMESRNIMCRDTSRFHNFKDGRCSCGGYW